MHRSPLEIVRYCEYLISSASCMISFVDSIDACPSNLTHHKEDQSSE